MMKVLTILRIVVGCLASAQMCHGAMSIPGRWGSGNVETFDVGVLVQNASAASITFGVVNSGGTYSSTPQKTFTATPALGSGGTASVQWQGFDPVGATTIPASSTRYFRCKLAIQATDPDAGTHTFANSISYKSVIAGVTNTSTVTSSFSVLLVDQSTNPPDDSIVAETVHRPAAGITCFPSGVTSATTDVIFFSLVLGAPPPPPPLGKITLHGMQGRYRASLKIDGTERASGTGNAPDATTVGTDVVWTTSSPADWIGAEVQLYINDALMPEKDPGQLFFTITANNAVTGALSNFDYLLQPFTGTFTDDGWLYYQLVYDPEGETEVPLPHSELDVPEPTPDSAMEQRPADPIADVGPDAATDATTDSDADGDDGLSVKDTYRAVRQGIQDALGGAGDGASFNFDDAIGGDEIQNAAAEGIGNTLGDVGDDLLGMAGEIGSMPVPGLTGGSGLAFLIAGHSVTIPPPPFPGWVRAFILMWVLIFTCKAAFSIVRSAFSGA